MVAATLALLFHVHDALRQGDDGGHHELLHHVLLADNLRVRFLLVFQSRNLCLEVLDSQRLLNRRFDEILILLMMHFIFLDLQCILNGGLDRITALCSRTCALLLLL